MKVFLDTIGCRLNQAEIETYAQQLRANGHRLVPDRSEADLVIVNTCSVTAQAASDSRQKIRQAARAGAGETVVTGCWSTLNPKAASALPGVSRVVPNMKKDNLVLDLLQIDTDDHELEPLEREPIPGARSRTRAFIKVQDGCDNRCTFCVTTLARGTGRSLTIKQILSDIQSALAGEEGAREVVLSGVHLGSWGYDFSKPQHLSQLVKAILMDTDVPRLRLSSLEPWDLDDNFFTLWENPRLCRHLHLPLQSGCESTLRRMARKTTPAAFEALIDAARTAVPDVAITTDLIAGFPGEDEIEFQESIEFTRCMQFAGGHVFTYSARPGTAAARMAGQVHHQERKDRNARLRAVLDKSAAAYRDHFLGRELPVLWESVTTLEPEIWHMNGLTDNYLRVHAKAPRHLWNRITNVRLTSASASGLQGILVP